ncbi:MAG TPA: transcriptional regulator [Nitrospirota bacterium]
MTKTAGTKTRGPRPPAEAPDETVRQRIRDYLKGGERSIRDISQELRISEKEALDHLEHIALARGGDERLVVTPSECGSCGYVFKKRERLGKPGRCPVCKGEKISQPLYRMGR